MGTAFQHLPSAGKCPAEPSIRAKEESAALTFSPNSETEPRRTSPPIASKTGGACPLRHRLLKRAPATQPILHTLLIPGNQHPSLRPFLPCKKSLKCPFLPLIIPPDSMPAPPGTTSRRLIPERRTERGRRSRAGRSEIEGFCCLVVDCPLRLRARREVPRVSAHRSGTRQT